MVDKSVKQIVVRIAGLASKASLIYSPMVDAIIASKSTNKHHIETTLDGMLDFCFDNKMLAIYKKLCKHYYYIDPRSAAGYVYAYRDMWDQGESKRKRVNKVAREAV